MPYPHNRAPFRIRPSRIVRHMSNHALVLNENDALAGGLGLEEQRPQVNHGRNHRGKHRGRACQDAGGPGRAGRPQVFLAVEECARSMLRRIGELASLASSSLQASIVPRSGRRPFAWGLPMAANPLHWAHLLSGWRRWSVSAWTRSSSWSPAATRENPIWLPHTFVIGSRRRCSISFIRSSIILRSRWAALFLGR